VLRAGDDLLLMRLAAILRLAEYLERGRTSAVDDVAISPIEEADGRKVLRLTLIADVYPAVEIWQTQRNAVDLMEKAYEREVVIDSTAAPG